MFVNCSDLVTVEVARFAQPHPSFSGRKATFSATAARVR